MPDYVTASATKDHFQNQLLQDHPEIVSIAPRLKLGDDGHPTTEAVIVVGVRARYPLRPGPGASAHPPAGLIPNELPAFDAHGAQLLGQTVLVLVEDEGEILPEMHTAARRPCPGGFSIGHYRIAAGTLGGVVSLGAAWGYILSNNHVLAATNSGAAGDPICQPGVVDGGTTATAIGTLHSWVPIDFSGRPNEADCALVQAQPPWANQVSRNVFGIGAPAGVAVATVGQAVRKSGRTTQITSGTILSDNATIRLSYGSGLAAVFVNQLQYTRMTQRGDSGSLIWSGDSLEVVGLHFAASGPTSYGNHIQRVLQELGQAARGQLSLI